jgi:hypothetical protein
MAVIQFQIRKDFSPMDRMERILPGRLSNTTKASADRILAHVRSNWTPNSPSAPGQRPAVVSGKLDKSGFVGRTSRDHQGRFVSEMDGAFHEIGFSAPHARIENDEGWGKVASRPYLRPSIDTEAQMFPIEIAKVFRF